MAQKYRKTPLAVLVLLLSICACSNKPTVPEVADPEHPVVDGVAMMPHEFLKKYCTVDVMGDKTCLKVELAKRRNSMGGGIPKNF